ncbi:hypothetical protein NSB25_00245 [Acetatifactor muris]|nr:hypothetical protein [Acetatifactor muris]MCR2045716.1 hypothetical protein [Acetatifactor muris]
MHNEFSQYSSNIPLLWYEDYDFEKRRPDMIYIHNPYDECNYVTSVHPFFYSKNLKKFTEKLVYIPYFILGEIDPENPQELEGVEKFCQVPGVLYADKVIVQSEAMRQAYIKIMTKFMDGQKGYEQPYWEEKILGLGSPKVDKVLSTRKEDLVIPEEWMKVIRKPDGSWKKIIFYNTTVTALLQHRDKMLIKIQDTLRVFYENRDEVTLFWRPHPLICATIEAMCPEINIKYKKIVKEYKRAGWGIYDESADMDRAVVLSDAYYGDRSSVLNLYEKTGKPTMMQDVNSLPENNFSLAMDDIVEYQGRWWFFSVKDHGIYRMDKENFYAELVARIPRDETIENYGPQYRKIFIYEAKIFILPWVPVKIAVYDIISGEIHYIDYERETVNRRMVFGDGIIRGNKLYVMPCVYKNILCIDMDSEDIMYIRLDEILHEDQSKHQYAWGSIFVDKDSVYMASLKSEKIIELELRSNKVNVYRNKLLTGGISGVCGDENNVWLVPQKADKILHWDRKRKKVEFIDKFPMQYQTGDFSFYKIVSFEKYLLLLPRDANMLLILDKTTNVISNLEFEEVVYDSENYYDKYFRYMNAWENNGEIYVINTRRGIVYCSNFAKGKKTHVKRHIKISDEYSEKCEKQEYENRYDYIFNYIKTLKGAKIEPIKHQNKGNEIWKGLKSIYDTKRKSNNMGNWPDVL